MHLLTCCFGCLSLFGCQKGLLRSRAFFPPDPPSYRMSLVGKDLVFCLNSGESTPSYQWLSIKVLILQTERSERIPALYLKHISPVVTILLSHGNANDIGQMRSYAIDLATQLRANVLLYEYTGYGLSTGEPSEEDMQADIKAAYWYLRNIQKVPWFQILAFGQSVGSGPTCYLASELPVGSIVLQSPLASGLRLFSQVKRSHWFDPFNNVKKAPRIRCPAFVMHGVDDHVVPLSHAQLLHSCLQLAAPGWWVNDADHTNIDVRYKQEFFEKLKQFVESVNTFQRHARSEQELEEKFYPRK